MFVAINTTDRTRVTSISSKWDSCVDALRELASSGQLVCQGCKQKVRLKAGDQRRRHFAHQHKSDCPLAHQSREVLEAKAQLYEWLETKYPGKVHLDMPLRVSGQSEIADLVVESEADCKFAYWVFDRSRRSRHALLFLQREAMGVCVHVIHTHSALKLMSDGAEIGLTASQRDFIAHSEFDKAVTAYAGGHLHFIVTLPGKLPEIAVFRSLNCVHKPNVYRYDALRRNHLSLALISPKTGEVVLTEDVEAWKAWKLNREGIKLLRKFGPSASQTD